MVTLCQPGDRLITVACGSIQLLVTFLVIVHGHGSKSSSFHSPRAPVRMLGVRASFAADTALCQFS